MTPCFTIEIETPKHYLLNGLWFGPRKAKRVVILTHGLSSSVFSKLGLLESWVNAQTAVLSYNNRGHDKIAKLRRITKKGMVSELAGAAHEVFTECADDIQGALDFAKRQGAKELYLAGHSTGCQKSVYYAAHKKDPRVKGLILLAPISDYSSTLHFSGGKKLRSAVKLARTMVKRGHGHELLPSAAWDDVIDAQRFLSLNTPESKEEIFTYANPKKKPATLLKTNLRTLVLLAENDEYGDRPANDIALWFMPYLKRGSAIEVIANVGHGFSGGERPVSKAVAGFIQG